ncbi:MAG: response regulator transcription factor [Saprospiraceae bacterium]|nr:response regulator transcription factor [Saprospiraceae bacterium]
MCRSTKISLFAILLCAGSHLFGQSSAVADTIGTRMALLTQLTQSGNYEQAQVEAEGLRELLKRHKVPVSPKMLMLISGIYKVNSDDRSATRFLADAELDARKDPNPVTKAALLGALVQECRKWDLPDQALTCQQLLATAQDSIAVRKRREESVGMQQKLDSLMALRQTEMSEQANYLHLERDKALMFGAAIIFVFLILLFTHYRNTDRWRKLLDKKEMEWDMLRTNLRNEVEENAIAHALETTKSDVVVAPAPPDPYTMYHGSKPEQIALLIEPNRQVVLYLKSLLSDRFQIETAATPVEGMQMANELMPDLVVCDAILNGKTGIEVARQIKLSQRTNHIPVVLLTDKFGNEGKLDALRAGAEAWFTRPVIDDEFDASVQRLLDARKTKHEHFSRFLQLFFSESRLQLEDPFLSRTIQMIEQNLADPDYTADDIARKLQMTKTHYVKKLKALTGKEPVQLIREMRLEKAKVLLEKRAGTPQAIAELVGFSSPGSFSLAFKEYFGENTSLLYTPPVNRLT